MVPTGGLDQVVVEEKLMKQLKEIVQFEKARYVVLLLRYMMDMYHLCSSILFGQWGFGKRMTEVCTKHTSL